jgi:cellulose synthase (UDP-forming)
VLDELLEHFLKAEPALILLIVGGFFCFFPWMKRDDLRIRRLLYWLFVAFQLRYLVWRFTATLPQLALGVTELLAYGYLAFETWLVLRSRKDIKLYTAFTDRSAEADAHMDWYSGRADGPPLVDYLIPTYNENYAVLERAIVTALAQDHARVRVWVLDDGRREWLRQLASEKGAEYLTRPNTEGFKAGNINHALEHIAGLPEPSDFIAVMDCDFVAKPTFVRRALSLMYDDSVAIVQTKQVYYNLDPFQYALPGGRGLPDWQRFAFDFFAPCLDVYCAQTCCGTCFLARRSSLSKIGGIPTESVAEDALATYALNALGLKTIYLAEALSYGIVAEGLREFLTQCGRWCLGRVQNIYSQWGGRSPHKTRWQRFMFFEQNIMWAVFSISKLIQLWLPIMYWFFGLNMFPGLDGANGFVNYFLPMYVFSLTTGIWLTNGRQMPIIGDAKMLLWSEVVIRATYRGLSRSRNFRFDVTDKGATRSGISIHWRPLKWLLLTGFLTIAGLLYRTLSVHPNSNAQSSYDVFAFFWSYYNLLSIAAAMALCIEPPQRRDEERFDTSETAWLERAGGTSLGWLANVSMSGALLRCEVPMASGQELTLVLADVGPLTATVVRCPAPGQLAVQFQTNAEQRERLIHKLYSDQYVRPIYTGSPLRVYTGLLRNALV